jgi:hypothetical protein
LVTLKFGGAAELLQMRGKAFRAALRVGGLHATDHVSPRTAFPHVLITRPRAGAAAAQPLLPAPALLDAPPLDQGGAAPPPPTTPPPTPLLELRIDAFPADRPDVDIVVRLVSQPVLLVVAPPMLRALAAFAHLPVAAGVGAELNSRARGIAGQVGSDVYGALAAHTRFDLDAHVAGPSVLLPERLDDARCRRMLLHLGDLTFTSAPASAAPVAAEASAGGHAVSSPATPHRRPVVSAVEDAGFDSWRLCIADVAMFMQPGRRGGDAVVGDAGAGAADAYEVASRPRFPVIEPVALELALQTCVLPASVAPNRMRVEARLPRLAVTVSLPFALQVGRLNTQLLGVLAGMQEDAVVLQAEYEASVAANAALEASFEAAEPRGTAPAPPPSSLPPHWISMLSHGV